LAFGFSGGERLICGVSSPRRFSSPNRATGFENIFRGEKKP
jgi:hypothetical protein